MSYKRFDRHEVFSMDDTSFVLDCISKVGRSTDDTAELTNMLYGLFDGFYYDKIHKYAAIHLSVSMFEQLEDILVKVDVWIAAEKIEQLEDILVKIDDSLIHVA